MDHPRIDATNPPKTSPRLWRCPYCGAAGTYEEVAVTPCRARRRVSLADAIIGAIEAPAKSPGRPRRRRRPTRH